MRHSCAARLAWPTPSQFHLFAGLLCSPRHDIVAMFGYEKALISVKAGENVSAQMIRDLRGTVEREKAKLGIFLTLAEPTKPMRAEAAAAGMAELEGVRCQKIQILTFEDLLQGKQPQLPYADYAFALPKANREEGEQGELL
jgi:hypothetical protein